MTYRLFFLDHSTRSANPIPNKHFISAIIPVYNEEKHLNNLLQALVSCRNINEIICVNDGSQDQSSDILNRYTRRIQIIDFQVNKGKGSALAAGIKAARGDIVIFLDADLINLNHQHIQALIDPLLEDQATAVVGYCKSSENHLNLVEFISGQRAYYKKDLLPHLNEMESMRYGIEMYLNSLFHPSDVTFIPLMKLRSAYKYEKQNSTTVAKQYYVEGKEIIQTLPKTVLTRRFAMILIDRIKEFLPLA